MTEETIHPTGRYVDVLVNLGRLDTKVDLLLQGKAKTEETLSEVSRRLQTLELDVAAMKTEKTTTHRNFGALWAFLTAAASLVLSLWSIAFGRG
jgi:hypothetical protein